MKVKFAKFAFVFLVKISSFIHFTCANQRDRVHHCHSLMVLGSVPINILKKHIKCNLVKYHHTYIHTPYVQSHTQTQYALILPKEPPKYPLTH